MKRILIGIVALAMLFALCACSEQQQQENDPETNSEETEQSTQEKPTLSGVDEVIPER